MLALCRQVPPRHDIQNRRRHCSKTNRTSTATTIALPDDLPMHRVHEVITSLEDRFKLEYPELHRVTIHPEPVTDNTR